MAYLPKSQISVKYADPGILETGEGNPYTGEYVETDGGQFYVGSSNMKLGEKLFPVKPKSNKTQGVNDNIRRFNIMKRDVKDFLSNTHLIPSVKSYPSALDYEKGYFMRYFSRRINGMGYIEIEPEVYKSIIKKEGKYDHNLNEVGEITWSLRGNVFQENALAIKALGQKWKNISYLFPIFNEFAKEPFKSQENLYTEGGELYYSDSTEYIGEYHIHTTMGPMKGAYHTEETHPQLFYIDELPTPQDMSYEEFMAGYPPPTKPQIPLRGDQPVRDGQTSTSTSTGSLIEESYNCIASWGPPPPNYEGMTDPNGLVPVSSTCMDPGDGSGTYKMISGGDIMFTALQNCINSCDSIIPGNTGTGIVIIPNSIGCKFPWDANYCESCSDHDVSFCAGKYNTGGGSPSGGGGGSGGGGVGHFGTGDCFVGETSIIMGDGTIKRIDKVIVGDIVKSEINTSTVIDIDIHKEKEYTPYSINNSEYFVTAEHPFKTTTGWKAIDPLETWKTHGIESNVLEIGDILITSEGTEEVKSINISSETVNTVYNLRLDNEHVYYANEYLVHNNKWGGTGGDDFDPWADPWGDTGFAAPTCSCGTYNGITYYSEACC